MTLLRLSTRQFRRGWKSGEYTVMAAALGLALAAVSAVGFFTARVRTAVVEQSGESLAADLVLQSGEAIPAHLGADARAAGAVTATVMDFSTVLVVGQITQLADVHAVSAGYPLRGHARIAAEAFGTPHTADGIPARGTLWAEPRILGALGLKVGDTVNVGDRPLRIAAAITYLPDSGFGFTALEPKIVVDQADLMATGLVSTNSRVDYKLLVAGNPDVIDSLDQRWHDSLKGIRVEDAKDGRPEIVNAIERSERFLALAALVSALISAVAVVLASRRYALRYTDTAAVLKCLGLTRRRVQTVLLLELLWLGLSAGLAGVILGYGAQYGLVAVLKDLLPSQLPPAPLTPAIAALGMGLVLLLGFALPPLMRLGDTPPARVLRRDLEPPQAKGYAVYGAAIAAGFGITLWQVRTLELAFSVLVGLGVTVLLLGLGALLMLYILKGLRRGGGAGWRYGLANLNRHKRDAIIQMVAFGIGLMVLLLLALVRTDILQSWRTTLPDDAPNEFIINIQPDERDTVTKFFTDHGVKAPILYPFVRARLSAIGGKPVTGMHFQGEDSRRMVEREQNLSWSYDLPAGDTIVSGQWWDAAQAKQPLASLEESFAAYLGVKVGDSISFDVAGTPLTVTVASIRKVRWDSFQPNFFVDLSPGALADHAGTWITSVYLPPEKTPILADLIRQLPSLTLFDINAIMQQVRQLMDEASLAVEYVFLFTLGAGVVVLLAAVQATRDERRFEAAVLRAIGASRRRLRAAALAEYAALGFASGLLGALAATLVAWALAVRIFNLPYRPDWRIWVLGVLAGTAIVAFSGMMATRRVLKAPPVETLREG
jgi:putative ABC transport system permease protein